MASNSRNVGTEMETNDGGGEAQTEYERQSSVTANGEDHAYVSDQVRGHPPPPPPPPPPSSLAISIRLPVFGMVFSFLVRLATPFRFIHAALICLKSSGQV